MSNPTCWIIAGPNGAGKTTFALKYLPEVAGCRHFVNADLIAAGLSPLAPESELVQAGKLFMREIRQHIARRQCFGFETTLSGRSYLRLIEDLRADGWEVQLIYLALPEVETSLARVAERVAHGGHSVPEDVVRRRFPRSMHNLLHDFAEVASQTLCFLNSGDRPELIFSQVGVQRQVANAELLAMLEGIAES